MLARFLRCLTPFLILVAVAAPAVAQGGEKPLYKLGLKIGNTPKISPAGKEAQAAFAADVFNATTEAFALSRRFTLIERRELDAVFKEKDLKNFLGKGDNRLADLLGLDYLGIIEYSQQIKKVPQRWMGKVWKKIDPKGNQNEEVKITIWTIDVRLVEVKTGQVAKVVSSADSNGFLPVPTPRAAGKLLHDHIREAYPPFGAIVKVAGKDVTIDLGESAGLQKKDVLEIVEEGEQLIHPLTGKMMAPYLVVIGQIRLTDLWPNMANGKITSSQQGKEIKPGCFVRFKGGAGFLKRTLDRAAR